MPKVIRYGAIQEGEAFVLVHRIVRVSKGVKGFTLIHLDTGESLECGDTISFLERKIESS